MPLSLQPRSKNNVVPNRRRRNTWGNRVDYWPFTDHYLLAKTVGVLPTPRGHSLMVKFQPSKLAMRVRFPLPAICLFIGKSWIF
jgi:hypothetical protein